MKHLAIYGACGGVLIVAMRLVEYRFLVVSHSIEIYTALIAALFAAVGIWFGLTITGRKTVVKEVFVPVVVTVPEVPQVGPFVADTDLVPLLRRRVDGDLSTVLSRLRRQVRGLPGGRQARQRREPGRNREHHQAG